MKKTLWLDTETTGLDCNKHGIIQIAMLMNIDGKLEGELLVDVQPFEDDIIEFETDKGAQNMTYEDIIYYPKFVNEIIIKPSMLKLSIIKDFVFPEEAHQKIIAFLDAHISKFDKADKAYLGGYSVNFDRGFISNWFQKCGYNYLGSYLNWKCLDPLYMLWQMDCDGIISLENYKLETACKHFGIELQAHNALSDVKATRELYYKLKEVQNALNQRKKANGMPS